MESERRPQGWWLARVLADESGTLIELPIVFAGIFIAAAVTARWPLLSLALVVPMGYLVCLPVESEFRIARLPACRAFYLLLCVLSVPAMLTFRLSLLMAFIVAGQVALSWAGDSLYTAWKRGGRVFSCPRCGKGSVLEKERSQGVASRVCPACGGRWFDYQPLYEWMNKRGLDRPSYAEGQPAPLSCAHCGKPMSLGFFQKCWPCIYVWVEGAEWEALLKGKPAQKS
ncbi:MAG: zf-TFIIB domain-containing protein [Elusimicrobia bacterium]|nr:zf-TFIIB domain-containing protein [Elusimicrobiota bacterium]